jgi:tetratricopeptide (TPR) repeat protein
MARAAQTTGATAARPTGGPRSATWLARAGLPVALVVLAIVLYAPFLAAPFVFDDETYITENPLITSLDFLVLKAGERAMEPFGPHYYLRVRIVPYLTFALNYRLGGLDPRGFRALNVAIHAANALVLYGLVLLLLRTPRMRGSGLARRARLIAFLAAALFAAHPLATQAVTYVSQRFASLAALFYLGAVAAYALAREEEARGPRRVVWYVLALALAALGMKTKEHVFTLPFALALFDLAFHEGPWRRRILWLLPFALTLPIVPLSLAGAGGGSLQSLLDAATRTQEEITRLAYFLTEPRVLLTYLRLLLLPLNQTLDYDYPVYPRMGAGDLALGWGAVLACMAGTGWLFVRSARGGVSGGALRLAAFGGAWFFVTLSVESSVVALADVIFEHRMYLAMAGPIAGAVALGAAYADTRGPLFRRAALALALGLVVLFGALTVARNGVWMDRSGLWEDAARKAPAKARVLHNLGTSYVAEGRIGEAIAMHERALALDPTAARVHANLGSLYYITGDVERSGEHYREALKYNPKSSGVLLNMGVVAADRGLYMEAASYFVQVLALDPDSVEALIALGNVHRLAGREREALAALDGALLRDPRNARAYAWRGVVHLGMGRLAEAESDARRALALDPDRDVAYHTLGAIALASGFPQDALRNFQYALSLNPGNQEYIKSVADAERSLASR